MAKQVIHYPSDIQPIFDEYCVDCHSGTQPKAYLDLTGDRTRFFYMPACARMTDELAARLRGAPLVFFDGTLWRDDEMIRSEVGVKTGKRMGHMSVSGDDGTLAAFAPLDVERKIFIHINTTNPILLDDSPERATVVAKGWEVAYDGMALEI